MLLYPSKSESMLVGTMQQLSKIKPVVPVTISASPVKSVDNMKLVGVTFDKSLTMDKHVGEICRSCNYHIRALRHIRPCIGQDAAAVLACSIVGSRIDYCNAALYGTSSHNLDHLQCIQNSLARVVCKARHRTSTAPLLRSLHWLPVRQRIRLKFATLTFKAHHNHTPAYLHDLLHPHIPTRSLRSADMHLLAIPFSHTVAGAKAFRSSASEIWNALPLTPRSEDSLERFISLLKTFFFTEAFFDS